MSRLLFLRKHASGSSKKRVQTAVTGHDLCGGQYRSMWKTRCPRRSFRVESKDQRRCKFTSRGKVFPSVLSVRQPRSSTRESDPNMCDPVCAGSTHGRPVPGSAGEKHLGFGGAAMSTSGAAPTRISLPFWRMRVEVSAAATGLLLASSVFAAAPHHTHAAACPASL